MPQPPEGSQAGWTPPHSVSAAQARQACVEGSQTGALALPQSASARQATQLPAPTSQRGVVPVQAAALLLEHWPQAPEGWQAGVDPPQSVSPAQARQACVVVLQTGVVPAHCVSTRQPTQLPALVSQTGVAPPQALAFVLEHWPHAPLGSQAGVAPPQSPSRAQERQTWLPPSQIGVVPLHCALETQATQVPLPVLQ
jgi:hypothetical protein